VLPGWARDVALVLPPTYIIADVRRVLLEGTPLSSLGSDLLWLTGAGILLCGGAAVAFGAAERRARAGSGFAQY
jgi:uncharacterized membrane protein YadS